MQNEITEARAIIAEMVRLADMGFEASLKEPEENGNYAAYERAKRFLSAALAQAADAQEPEREMVWIQNLKGFIRGVFPANDQWKEIFIRQLNALYARPSPSEAVEARRLALEEAIEAVKGCSAPEVMSKYVMVGPSGILAIACNAIRALTQKDKADD
jgi:hypothetical protein